MPDSLSVRVQNIPSRRPNGNTTSFPQPQAQRCAVVRYARLIYSTPSLISDFEGIVPTNSGINLFILIVFLLFGLVTFAVPYPPCEVAGANHRKAVGNFFGLPSTHSVTAEVLALARGLIIFHLSRFYMSE